MFTEVFPKVVLVSQLDGLTFVDRIAFIFCLGIFISGVVQRFPRCLLWSNLPSKAFVPVSNL